MSMFKRNSRSSRHFEVIAHRPQGETVIFASSEEPEAVSFAIDYTSRNPFHAVTVNEEYYDPSDQLFKSRRVWSRGSSYQPPSRQRVVTVRR